MQNTKNIKPNIKWYASWWFILSMLVLSFFTFGITLIFVPISLLIRAYVLMKQSKEEKEKVIPVINSPNQENKASIKKPLTIVDFKVAGVSFDNEGVSRQMILKKAAAYHHKLTEEKKYGGMTKDEILDNGVVYEYDELYIAEIELEKDPINKYDSNAIKVLIENENEQMVLIGYVPKNKNKEVNLLMDKGNIKHIEGMFTGGKYKIENDDYDSDKEVIIEEKDRGMIIKLHLIEQ